VRLGKSFGTGTTIWDEVEEDSSTGQEPLGTFVGFVLGGVMGFWVVVRTRERG